MCVFRGAFWTEIFPDFPMFFSLGNKDSMSTPKFFRLAEKAFRFQTMFYRFGKIFPAKIGVFVWCCYASFLYLQQTNPL